MTETKTKRRERLRAMRKKYGLGEFKKNRSHSIKRTRRLKTTMAKKRSSTRRRRSNFGGTNTLMNTALGTGLYILFEGLAEPKLAEVLGNGLVLNIAELAAGVYMARKGGIIGSMAKTSIVINTYQVLKPYMANISSSVFN